MLLCVLEATPATGPQKPQRSVLLQEAKTSQWGLLWAKGIWNNMGPHCSGFRELTRCDLETSCRGGTVPGPHLPPPLIPLGMWPIGRYPYQLHTSHHPNHCFFTPTEATLSSKNTELRRLYPNREVLICSNATLVLVFFQKAHGDSGDGPGPGGGPHAHWPIILTSTCEFGSRSALAAEETKAPKVSELHRSEKLR